MMQYSICKSTLFLLISEAIHKVNENNPRKIEMIMEKINANLHLGGVSIMCFCEENI
jgi:NADH:ubiquinone oxidoreductase subunit 5 (subunit L)/multisubunit Na+/H+ antiporter MnhA subunit